MYQEPIYEVKFPFLVDMKGHQNRPDIQNILYSIRNKITGVVEEIKPLSLTKRVKAEKFVPEEETNL